MLYFLLCWVHFNTSHVNVNHTHYSLPAQRYEDFNTSHVNVNQYQPYQQIHNTRFQYISC